MAYRRNYRKPESNLVQLLAMHPSNEPNAFEPPLAATLVDLLRIRASATGGREAFCFIREDGKVDVSITYGELHQRAMAIAGELQTLMAEGDRALLLYPPGLEFIAAFFGCLYAGVAAVPVALPARNRSTSSVEAILRASNPAVILSSADHCESSRQHYARVPALLERPWIATDQVPDDRQDAWREPPVDGRQTAFLQYTSGSTSAPKGVMLSHENLLRNAAAIQQAFGNTPEGQGVFWLPLYHDMGLIGGVVQPIYCGGRCAVLAPVAFLQRPALWLETISKTQASVSGGPDFAYDLCVRKIPAEERDGLDLSSWKVAFTGAERIRASTIERFAEAFGPCGFRREAFFPCYGLAEATLMVSGGPRQTPPTIVRVARRRPDAQSSSGRRRRRCALANVRRLRPELARAYHCHCRSADARAVRGRDGRRDLRARPERCRRLLRAARRPPQAAFGRLLSTGEGPFLRTGDLGFLRDGQLFVTGRLKDVIIIRGRNYYPEDIEHSLDGAHPAFRAGHCVAFSIEVEDRERLVVVQEIEPRRRDLDVEDGLEAVRRAIAVATRVGSLCDRAGQGGRDPQDFQRKDAAFGVPRALSERAIGGRRPKEGGPRDDGRRCPKGARHRTAVGRRPPRSRAG